MHSIESRGDPPRDLFSLSGSPDTGALERCVRAREISILNLTRAEALIHPSKAGVVEQAATALEALDFVTYPVSDDVADQALLLRAAYGNRNFPIIDAIVVAVGLVHDMSVVTADVLGESVAVFATGPSAILDHRVVQ